MSYSSEKRIYDLTQLDQFITFKRDWAGTRVLNPVGAGSAQVTLTRSGTATRVNELGLIESVSANLPRFDFDPVSKECRGLLIESARTNLYLHSSSLDVAAWSTNASSLNASGEVTPSNTSALKCVPAATLGFHGITQVVSIVSGSTYSVSFFAKAAEYSGLCLVLTSTTFGVTIFAHFNLLNGASQTNSGTVRTYDAGNGWWRCVLTALSTGTASAAPQIRVQQAYASGDVQYTGDGVSGIYLWGGQIEVGPFVSSYIPTTTATVARGAETVTCNSQKAFSRNEITVHTKYRPNAVIVNNRYERVWNLGGSGDTINYVNGGSTSIYSVQSYVANIYQTAPPAVTQVSSMNHVFALNSNTASQAFNGTVSLDTSPYNNNLAGMPDLFGIGGQAGSSILDGHISAITLYNKALSKPVLKALTLS